MADDIFPRSALEANGARRLTQQQISALKVDARGSGRLAGVTILAVGLFILWGALRRGSGHAQQQPLE